jgi:hypothetical protein
MRDWEDIKTKWDGSRTEYLKLDYGLLEVRQERGGVGGAEGRDGEGRGGQAGRRCCAALVSVVRVARGCWLVSEMHLGRVWLAGRKAVLAVVLHGRHHAALHT